MSTLNKVMLIGNLGDAVKMHQFEGGGCIGRFPIATSISYISKQTNERVEETEWHNIVVRNKIAEICEKYLQKGNKVHVEGQIKTRKWQDTEGNDRYSTEIHARDIIFLTPKNESNQAPAQQSQEPQGHQGPIGEDNDDLPF